MGSFVRKQILPHAKEEFAGYIAWRGVMDDNEIYFNNHAAYFVFSSGHIVFYRIPARDYQITGKTQLNWVMYESTQNQPLTTLLTDKFGRKNPRSISSGNLSEVQLRYLHELSRTMLPADIAKTIYKTQHPFIQAIFDFQLPTYENQAVIFVGDSAATLRPHTGSGVLKALTNAIALFNLVQNLQSDVPIEIQWQQLQRHVITEEIQKAKIMGHALVTHPPKWASMTQTSTDQWWTEIMQNKTWYATAVGKKDMPGLFKEDTEKHTSKRETQAPSDHMQSKL